jgi:hypothetical protein
MAISTRQILKAIGSTKLELVHVARKGYWYFAYTDNRQGRMIYDTHSVYIPRLNDMPLDMWVADGKEFAQRMDAK